MVATPIHGITVLLQQAVRAHQAGAFDQAKQLYLQILRQHPLQFDALHLLGVLSKQTGDAEHAIEYIQRALSINNQHAAAHCNLGAAYQALSRSQEAIISYDHALALKPDYTLAWNNRGNALRSIGEFEHAQHSFTQALQLAENDAEIWFNRGLNFHAAQRFEAALADFDRALHFRPRYAAAHCARGATLHQLRHYEDAVAAFDAALQLQDNYPEAHCNRGLSLYKSAAKDLSQTHIHSAALAALTSFERALQLKPNYAKAQHYRANLLRELGQPSAAIEAYQQALQHTPTASSEATQIHYALAALGAAPTPASAPSAYVKELFDQYADHFEQHLTTELHYQVPQRISAALAKLAPRQFNHTLDLGCGTGLCAPFLRPISRHLTGLDLSENMLAKAEQKQCYDTLVCAELVEFLSLQQQAYDLIIAADVFVYIGDLLATFQAVQNALRPNGIFCFSVEHADDSALKNHTDYQLKPSQRYAHHTGYLQTLADECGLSVKEITQDYARQDKGEALLIDIVVMVLR